MTHLRSLSRFNWIIALAALVALVGADIFTDRHPPLQPDKTWAEVQKRGALYWGMDATFAPFESVDASGAYTGLDVELAREIARRLNLRAEFVQIGADRLYDTLMARQCDVLISALTPDAARLKDFAYSQPYLDAGLVLVAPRASTLVNLRGHAVAVEQGSEGDAHARWLARRTVGLRVIETDSPQAALQTVEQQQAEVALTDTATARQYAAQHPALSLGRRETSAPYVLAVRVESRDLLRALDATLAHIKADGTLEQIVARWLDR
jgi:ABC-type amino acid transport substrate-binding protein